MSTVWKNHAINLMEMLDSNKDEQAHNYLEQLLLLPHDSQDRIIDEISKLSYCHSDAVAEIINRYSMGQK